jgi:hypothetical protein
MNIPPTGPDDSGGPPAILTAFSFGLREALILVALVALLALATARI